MVTKPVRIGYHMALPHQDPEGEIKMRHGTFTLVEDPYERIFDLYHDIIGPFPDAGRTKIGTFNRETLDALKTLLTDGPAMIEKERYNHIFNKPCPSEK